MPKSFKYWFADDVEITFGIKRMDTISALEDWRQAEATLTTEMTASIVKLKKALLRNADAWNEEELKVFFIAHILELIDFEIEYGEIKLKPFLDRALSFSFENEVYKGEVDFIVATGRQVPRKPYFFVHEYKQETKKDTDPLGQLLMGMLAARFNNEIVEQMYGIYIVGRNWFFVVLNDKNQYAVSPAYDATQDDIFQIVGILQKTKQDILQAIQK